MAWDSLISPESQIVVCLSCTIPKEVTQKETATVGLEKAIKELTPNPSCDSQVHVLRGGVNRFVGFSAGAIMLNLVESVPSQTVSHWLHTKTTKDRNTENEAASNFGKVTAKHDECGFFGDEQKLDLFACPINVSRVHKELLLGMLSPILTWTMSGLPSGMGWYSGQKIED